MRLKISCACDIGGFAAVIADLKKLPDEAFARLAEARGNTPVFEVDSSSPSKHSVPITVRPAEGLRQLIAGLGEGKP